MACQTIRRITSVAAAPSRAVNCRYGNRGLSKKSPSVSRLVIAATMLRLAHSLRLKLVVEVGDAVAPWAGTECRPAFPIAPAADAQAAYDYHLDRDLSKALSGRRFGTG